MIFLCVMTRHSPVQILPFLLSLAEPGLELSFLGHPLRFLMGCRIIICVSQNMREFNNYYSVLVNSIVNLSFFFYFCLKKLGNLKKITRRESVESHDSLIDLSYFAQLNESDSLSLSLSPTLCIKTCKNVVKKDQLKKVQC